MNYFLQAELNKVAAENGPVESGSQADDKNTIEKTNINNPKHHLLLLQVNKSFSFLSFLSLLICLLVIVLFFFLFLAACGSDWL